MAIRERMEKLQASMLQKRLDSTLDSARSRGTASAKGPSTFEYVVVNSSGVRHKGKMQASSASSVSETLQADGWLPLEVREVGGAGLSMDLSAFVGGEQKLRLSTSEAAPFFRQVSELLKAGVPISRVLTALSDEASPKVRQVCLGLSERLNSGVPLSEAMLEFPDAFDAVTRAYVAAGESSGTLPETMGRLALIMEKRNAMRLKIKAVTAYPKMVGGAILVIVTAIIIFLVPRFQAIYAEVGSELPLPTRVLVWISENILPIKPELSFPMPFFMSGDVSIVGIFGRLIFIIGFVMGTDALRNRAGKEPKLRNTIIKWVFVIAVTVFASGYTIVPASLLVWSVVGGVFFGVKFFLSSRSSNERLAEFIDTVRFKIPIFGEITRRNALFQWSSTMAGALGSGVSLTQALTLAGATSGSQWYEVTSSSIEDQIRAGKPLSEALASQPKLYPSSIRAMVATGETTGDMSTMFESISSTIDSEIDSLVAGLSAKVEVALLLVMAVVVGGLLVALYLPIIQLATTYGGEGV